MAEPNVVTIDRDNYILETWKPGPGSSHAQCIRRCQVAIGKQGFTTPRGAYETGNRSRTPDWQAPDWAEPPLTPGTTYKYGEPHNPYRAGLITLHGTGATGTERTGYAMHGTTNEDSIPGRASHGCIRLREHDILWLYEHLDDNTLVIVI